MLKTEAHRLHLSQARKGVPNFKLRKGENRKCQSCGSEFYAARKNIKNGKAKYCSKSCYFVSKKGKATWNKGVIGYKQPNISRALKGKKASIEARKQMSISRKGKLTGEKNPMWKGGLTSKNSIVRHSFEYKMWRQSVFEKDDYTCVFCNSRSKSGNPVVIHADHIKPFSLYPELRFDLSNGRTLCINCHRKTETYGGKIYAQVLCS